MENKEYSFDKVSPDNVVEVRQIIADGLAGHFGNYDISFNPDLENILETYNESLHSTLYIIKYGNTIVGTGALTEVSDKVAKIQRMSVKKEYRRSKVGARMIAYIEEEARKKSYDKIVLETMSIWHEVVNFYIFNGYTKLGEEDGDTHFEKVL